jgi:hypothetical protein
LTAHQDNTQSELLFSTSRSSAKLFKTLLVEAGASSRIYLRYKPHLPPHLTQQPMTFSIVTSCKLVKNDQIVKTFKAICHAPSLQLDVSKLEFHVTRKEEDAFALDTPQLTVRIKNIRSEEVRIAIVSNDALFTVHWDSNNVLESGQDTLVTVIPKLTKPNLQALQAEHFLEEMIALYNVNKTSEKHFVPCRLYLEGFFSELDVASASQFLLAHEYLEQRVVKFFTDLEGYHALDAVGRHYARVYVWC